MAQLPESQPSSWTSSVINIPILSILSKLRVIGLPQLDGRTFARLTQCEWAARRVANTRRRRNRCVDISSGICPFLA